jgi:hypothetical protein
MQIVEIDLKLPYKERGSVLSKIVSRFGGRIRDIHFHPPDANGLSEVRIEVLSEGTKAISELKKVIKNGKVSFRILSTA